MYKIFGAVLKNLYSEIWVHFGIDSVEIWLLIGEIALLTDTAKQTIICVKCCANSFFVFRCIFIAFVSFLLVVFIFRYHTRW